MVVKLLCILSISPSLGKWGSQKWTCKKNPKEICKHYQFSSFFNFQLFRHPVFSDWIVTLIGSSTSTSSSISQDRKGALTLTWTPSPLQPILTSPASTRFSRVTRPLLLLSLSLRRSSSDSTAEDPVDEMEELDRFLHRGPFTSSSQSFCCISREQPLPSGVMVTCGTECASILTEDVGVCSSSWLDEPPACSDPKRDPSSAAVPERENSLEVRLLYSLGIGDQNPSWLRTINRREIRTTLRCQICSFRFWEAQPSLGTSSLLVCPMVWRTLQRLTASLSCAHCGEGEPVCATKRHAREVKMTNFRDHFCFLTDNLTNRWSFHQLNKRWGCCIGARNAATTFLRYIMYSSIFITAVATVLMLNVFNVCIKQCFLKCNYTNHIA